jgi:lysophospholipase L1-like esterase
LSESSRPVPPRPRRRLFAAVTVLLPFVLLLVLEGALRLSGFGQVYPLFVPVAGSPDFLRANPDVVRRFMVDERDTPNLWIRPVFFPRRKAPGTFRIFVQGESTTEGYPYGFGASPAGMLQQRLQRTFPERRIEVVTTAMSAVSSYVLLDFSREILEQAPDAVVIYAGHNEYAGVLGVGSDFSLGRRRPVVLSILALKDMRILQLARRALASFRPPRPRRTDRTLMATIVAEKRIPYGSPLYRRGLEQYRANLSVLLRRYRAAGVPVFLGTVVSNERDQPPFLSGHGPGVDVAAWRRRYEAGRAALVAGHATTAATAALREFDAAVALDDADAAGHFGRGQALERLGRYGEACQAYLAAKDRDQLRFRAPEEINEILRQVAAEEGAHVVEVREAFHRAAEHGIVGHDLMLEHLHPNLSGYFLLADAFYDAFHAQGMIGPWVAPVPREQARREIPVTEVDRLYGEWRARYLTSDWPFTEPPEPFQLPLAKSPVERIAASYYGGSDDWPNAMRRLLTYYRSIGDDSDVARVAVLLAEAFPNRAEDQRVAAEVLLAAGRSDASVYLRQERRAQTLARRRGSDVAARRSPG